MGICIYNENTVWPLLSSHLLRPPSIKPPFFKVPNFLSVNCCIGNLYSTATSILSGRGHLLAVATVIVYCFFTSIKRPAYYLFKRNGDRKTIIWSRALQRPCTSPINPHSLPSFTVTRTLSYFFLLLHLCIWQQQIAVNVQIEGTLCFVMMIFVFYLPMCTFTCVLFSTTMLLDIESVKSQKNIKIYYTSVKCPTSIKRPVFKVLRVAAS